MLWEAFGLLVVYSYKMEQPERCLRCRAWKGSHAKRRPNEASVTDSFFSILSRDACVYVFVAVRSEHDNSNVASKSNHLKCDQDAVSCTFDIGRFLFQLRSSHDFGNELRATKQMRGSHEDRHGCRRHDPRAIQTHTETRMSF